MRLSKLVKKPYNMKHKLLFWGELYWITLTISFMWSIQARWGAYLSADFSLIKYVIATMTITCMLIALPGEKSISTLFVLVILFVVVFPMGIIYSCQNRESINYISVFVSILLVEIMLPKMVFHKIRIRIGNVNFSKVLIWLLCGILIISVYFMYREMGIPNTHALNLSLVYEIRSSYLLSPTTSDLYNIATKAIIPFLIAMCFIKKKYKTIIILMAVQFLYYLWLANKTTIFSLIIFIFGYFVAKLKNGELVCAKIMTLGVLSLTVIRELLSSTTSVFSTTIDLIYSLVIRRTLFEPALLKYNYFDFFVNQGNQKTGLFGTIVAPILTRVGIAPPYSGESYPRLIGKQYLDGSSANTGIFGDEIAHFGYFGIIVAGILLLVFLVCIKKSESINGKVFTCCMTLYLVLGLIDSGVIQILNFSPMLLVVLVLWLFDLGESKEEGQLRRCQFWFGIKQL